MPNFGAFRNNTLITYIAGDATQLNKTLDQSTRNINTFTKKVEKAGKKNEAAQAGLLGGGFGRGGKVNQGLRGLASGTGLGSAALFGSGPFIGAALAAGAIKKSVDAASSLNEQITKSQQIFGAASKSVLDWSKTTSRSIFISQRAALEASGTFGNLFKAQGFSDVQNSKLSKSLVNLAGDLASFNDLDVNQVLQDLQSGIVGEIEPVRKYGADLRVAKVQQEALAESGKKNVKELTSQELTLARLHLLYKDTAAAQGDAARTAGGLANQERKIAAQVDDLAANLGTLLTPAVTALVTELNDAAGVAIKVSEALQKIASIKIPTIHIPIVGDIGGGAGGAILKRVAEVAQLGNPVFGALFAKNLFNDVRHAISGGADKAANEQKSGTVADLNKSLNGFLINVIKDVKPTDELISKGIGGALDFFKGKLNKKIGRVKVGINISNLIDSAQLGVEKSQVSGSIASQLTALQALKSGIEKQIAAGIDVKSAQHDLVSVEGQIADLQKQSRADGFASIISSLQLGVDKSSLTKGLGDDLKALEALRDGLRAQVKAGVDVANNQSQLVSVLSNIKALREQIAQNSKDAVKASAFKQIGLSATGGEIIPGVSNLKKQLEQLKSSDLSNVPKKLANRLAGVGKVLSDPIKSSIPEVRSAIKDLFSAIRSELNNQSKNGPLTKTTSLNTNKILKGLGLDPASAKEIRSRLSKFNSGGVALAGTGVVASPGGFPTFGGGDTHVTVELDGQKIEKSVTVRQQKRSRRNPTQKRGPTVHNI